ncbi:hypothetical protein DPMN_071450 [Dreissena polymorpha]|uniref:Uncharacterized protein n=1 Tax=Dreissena polymorpha TaxID=45954 RepID=A0A9D3Z6R0_DREPO|nr:hypothetical protein DPMN_071450 [Dreissena polymorpha]
MPRIDAEAGTDAAYSTAHAKQTYSAIRGVRRHLVFAESTRNRLSGRRVAASVRRGTPHFVSATRLGMMPIYNKYLYFFGEPPRVKTRRDAADRCRGRNRRGVQYSSRKTNIFRDPRSQTPSCVRGVDSESTIWSPSSRVCPPRHSAFCLRDSPRHDAE